MKVLIIGGGNGGLSFGVKLMENDIEVNLYDKFQDILEPIIHNNNEITLMKDTEQVTKRFHLVTTNLKEAIENVAFIFVITPAFAHQYIAKDIAKYVTDDQIVVLHPGRTGGALEVKHIFNQNHKHDVVVGEAETLLFACRKIDSTKIKIYGTKESVGISTLPSQAGPRVTKLLNQMLPHFHRCNSILETSISNIGSIFHPAPFLFNLSRIECEESFKYYHEGITPKIARLLEELDKERIAIGKGYGITVRTAREWLNDNYRLKAATLYEAIQMNESYRSIDAPNEVHSRYVLEDVPMGLVPLSYLARKAKVETPLINFLIKVASTMFEENFYETGRTLTKMGLEEN